MARSASNSVTIFDVVDGSDPIVAYQTNPAHTFIASSDGAVTAAVVNSYSNLIYCYIGGDKATASTATSDAAMANSSFRLSSSSGAGNAVTVSAAGWPASADWDYTAETDQAIKLTAPLSALSNSTPDSATAILHIRIKNAAGTVSSVNQDISFTKALAGSNSNVITLTSKTNIFTANSAGTIDDGQGDIVVTIETQGSPGDQTYEVALNGGDFVTRTSAFSNAGQIYRWDDNLTGPGQSGTIGATAQRLFISDNNLGDGNNSYQLRVSGADGGSDTLNIVKVSRGVDAANAIVVSVSSSTTDVFSSTDTADKTLTARAYDQSSGSEITTGLTYDWRLGAPDSTDRVQVDAGGNVVESGGSDATGKTIIVDDDDVDGSQQYSCIVTATQENNKWLKKRKLM